MAFVFRKLVLREGFFTFALAGRDVPLGPRSGGDRPSPFAVRPAEFCRLEADGRGELGGLPPIDDIEFEGCGLLLTLAIGCPLAFKGYSHRRLL